mgnify:CR=1 FL=1
MTSLQSRGLFFLSFSFLLAEPKLPKDEHFLCSAKYLAKEQEISKNIQQKPGSVALHSTRGDLRLFLGDFLGARRDYEKMIQLDPSTEISHWRLGIAYFYLGLSKKAAHQFEIYHQYDSVDRENGIWRFMSQVKEVGVVQARKNLLPYVEIDRPPYPWLYDLFRGKLQMADVFRLIEQAGFDRDYKERVLFHAYLYAGVYTETVEGNIGLAEEYLSAAVLNQYGRTTGTYMWQVARLHHQQLRQVIKER